MTAVGVKCQIGLRCCLLTSGFRGQPYRWGGGDVRLGRPLRVRVCSEGRIQRLTSGEKEAGGNPLVFQWLGLSSSTAEGPCPVPAQGTEIPAWHDCAPSSSLQKKTF